MTDTQTKPHIMELRAVGKSYRSEGIEVDVLRNVNLTLSKGESMAILGPSGCGKSTLLNLIGTLDSPTTGRVLLDGVDLQTCSAPEIAHIRNRRIGLVFQAHHLLPQCTVLENVILPTLADPRARPANDVMQRAARLLERVGLANRLRHRPGQLSGGERQRVAVVRALINEPLLLLADEPTGSLDRASAESLAELLAGLNRDEGVTLVVATHSSELARHMARVCEIRDGALEPLPTLP